MGGSPDDGGGRCRSAAALAATMSACSAADVPPPVAPPLSLLPSSRLPTPMAMAMDDADEAAAACGAYAAGGTWCWKDE